MRSSQGGKRRNNIKRSKKPPKSKFCFSFLFVYNPPLCVCSLRRECVSAA